MADESKCGTYAEYQAHRKRGEKPCDACSDARSQYARDRRTRIGKGRIFYFPTEDPRQLVEDFDGIGAVIARSMRESA